MKDYRTHLEKLRKDAAECALIRDLASDAAKRELFNRLQQHLTALADELEKAASEYQPLASSLPVASGHAPAAPSATDHA